MDWSHMLNVLINEAISVVISAPLTALLVVLLFEPVQKWLDERKFGKWRVTILGPKGDELLNVPLSAGKAKSLLEEEADKRVYIKGLIGTFADLKTDCIGQDAIDSRLFTEDKVSRMFVIDLAKNTWKKKTLLVIRNRRKGLSSR